jgi:hypothetical protein
MAWVAHASHCLASDTESSLLQSLQRTVQVSQLTPQLMTQQRAAAKERNSIAVPATSNADHKGQGVSTRLGVQVMQALPLPPAAWQQFKQSSRLL